MFTGIVTDVGEIRSVKLRADNLHRITIFCRYPRAELIEGASVACSGCCLTVVDTGEEDGRTWFVVDAADETLRVTTVGRSRHGTRINLERPLKLGDELGGHLVAGHVDGLATVIVREDMTDMARFRLARAGRACPLHRRRRARSRSTASRSPSTRSRGDTFSVLIIPHTLAVTTFGAMNKGATTSISKSTPWPATPRG